MLLVQQFLTRVFTILFNSGLAFLAISTTFLGLGSAGVCVYVFPRLFPPQRIPRLVPVLGVGYALSLVAGFAALVAMDHASTAGDVAAASLPSQVTRVIGSALIMLPAMILIGLLISLVLRAHSARVNRLYGADLAGGGIGCLLVLPLMDWIGGDQGIFAIGALAAAGAALLGHAHGRRRSTLVAAGVTALMLALPWFNRDLSLVDVRSHRSTLSGVEDWVLEDRELARTWNSLSRLGIFGTRDASALYVRIDSSCQTTIPSHLPEHREAYVASTDFERLPFVLDRHRRYLEIGAGGGRGMVLADSAGAEEITGVEINPGIVDASLAGFPGYGVTPLLANSRHRYLPEEGRSFARRCGERFDAVTITFIQTGIASGSAAFALSEANLFTVEAFAEFLGLLEPGGAFYVYRHGGNEMLRLLAITREALGLTGAGELREHVYLARNESNRAMLLISPTPFSAGEVGKLDLACRDLGIEVLYSPSTSPDARPPNPFPEEVRKLREAGELGMGGIVRLYRDLAHHPQYESIEQTFIETPDPQGFLEDYVVDVRPSHDDRPYYFFYGLNHLRDVLLYFDVAGTGILGGTVILLFWMAAAFSVLVTLMILLPLVARRVQAAGRGVGLAVVAYFSGLGLGYMAVQISFIQRFSLFLGHPVYAISVVLLSFLLCSGLGSLSSDRFFRSGRLTFARTIGLLVVLLIAYNELLPRVFHSGLIGWPVAAKIGLSFLLIFPLAFLMGFLFPQGIRLVDSRAPQLTPWAWGANSAASVLGSIFALVLAIHLGFSAVALIAAATYAAFCLPSVALLRRTTSQA